MGWSSLIFHCRTLIYVILKDRPAEPSRWLVSMRRSHVLVNQLRFPSRSGRLKRSDLIEGRIDVDQLFTLRSSASETAELNFNLQVEIVDFLPRHLKSQVLDTLCMAEFNVLNLPRF